MHREVSMAKFSSSILFLALLHCLHAIHAVDVLQASLSNLTSIENANKNEGHFDSSEDGEDGDIHLGPPGNKKGDHLASAAPYLRALNATLADEIQSTAGMPAKNAQEIEAGGDNVLWGALYPSLKYYGGSLLTSKTTKVYFIFYGSWSAKRRQPFINFVRSLSSRYPSSKSVPSVRDWWAINYRNYYDFRRRYVSANVAFGGQRVDNYGSRPKGTSSRRTLSTGDIRNIVQRAIRKGLKFDPSGAYFVLTSKDVYVNTFCTTTCSYHSFFTFRKRKVAFSFVGDSSSQCQPYCTYQYMDPSGATYNGLGIDGMISMFAHELAGLTTNPFQGKSSKAGWVVAGSQIENSDLCTWTFGQNLQWESKPPHRVHNLVGTSRTKFIIQQNFNLKTRSCELRYKPR